MLSKTHTKKQKTGVHNVSKYLLLPLSVWRLRSACRRDESALSRLEATRILILVMREASDPFASVFKLPAQQLHTVYNQKYVTALRRQVHSL